MFRQYPFRRRVASLRCPKWDYSSNGSYFVTICTKNREHYFGEIHHGIVYKSELGDIVELHWNEIPERFPFTSLGPCVVMPNHVHGIIHCWGRIKRAAMHDPINDIKRGGITGIYNPMLHQNLSTIIRWFKGRVSFECHKINRDFNWQRGFHDRIIRTETEFNNIASYIIHNPVNWKEDKSNESGL